LCGRDAYDCSGFVGLEKKVMVWCCAFRRMYMDRNMILFSGLRCKVNTKAAFVDMCMKAPALASKIMQSPVVVAECGRKVCSLYEDEVKNGVVSLRVELNEEKRERIYEEVFGDKLRSDKLDTLLGTHKKLLDPIEMMHNKEMEIDVIPFIVYGIARNGRCRSVLQKTLEGSEQECLTAFQESPYDTSVFLRKFLLEERKSVKLATGLLLIGRKEASEEKYRMIMNVIYAGYRPLKNATKNLERLEGEMFQDIMDKDMVMELILSQMVIQMVIAQDLCVPLVEDYQFCQVVCLLKAYDGRMLHQQVKERDMTEGKRIYRKLLRSHWEPGAYYVSAFLESESQGICEAWEKVEDLLKVFGIDPRALYGLCLEKWEAEMLCTIFEEKDWERYKYLLLLATLCKYIQQIEAMYENDIPEEIQYRKSCEESTVKNMEYERKRLEERICRLERQKREKEQELSEAERMMERLKRESQRNEEQHEKERAELIKLREFILHWKEEGVEDIPYEDGGRKQPGEDGKPLDIGRLDRSIVIGGHRNWQKKLRQCLPGSQFLASDYMNFDPAVLHNKKYIIVNTDILKHGLYYKIMNERKKEQKILYVHGNNVDRTLREIAKQLG